VRYPWDYYRIPPDEPARRLLTEFQPLAQRLEPVQNARPPSLSVASLKPLQDLVAEFAWYDDEADLSFGGASEVDATLFVQWGKKVRGCGMFNVG